MDNNEKDSHKSHSIKELQDELKKLRETKPDTKAVDGFLYGIVIMFILVLLFIMSFQ